MQHDLDCCPCMPADNGPVTSQSAEHENRTNQVDGVDSPQEVQTLGCMQHSTLIVGALPLGFCRITAPLSQSVLTHGQDKEHGCKNMLPEQCSVALADVALT